MDPSIRVLFLCTGNSARSQIAEAWLRRLGGPRFEVTSAGTNPQGINPLTYKAMAEAGDDLNGHRSKGLQLVVGQHFDYIITLCGHAAEACPAFPGEAVRMHWGFDDPAGVIGTEEERLAKFREVRDQIKRRVEQFVREGISGRN